MNRVCVSWTTYCLVRQFIQSDTVKHWTDCVKLFGKRCHLVAAQYYPTYGQSDKRETFATVLQCFTTCTALGIEHLVRIERINPL